MWFAFILFPLLSRVHTGLVHPDEWGPLMDQASCHASTAKWHHRQHVLQHDMRWGAIMHLARVKDYPPPPPPSPGHYRSFSVALHSRLLMPLPPLAEYWATSWPTFSALSHSVLFTSRCQRRMWSTVPGANRRTQSATSKHHDFLLLLLLFLSLSCVVDNQGQPKPPTPQPAK